MARRALRADRKGQFLVLISLGIVVMMVAFSAALSYTAVSPIYFPKTNFKGTVTQLSTNFRQALAIAIADVSKEMDRIASSHQYVNYTKLDEYPEAKYKGYESLTEWQIITLLRQSGLGLNMTVSEPVFDCNWGSAEGYSRVEANMTLDILSYGFYGWKNEVTVELNLRVLSMTYMDDNITSFGFTLKREQGIPVSGLNPSLIKIFFQIDEERFELTPASILGFAYFGDGNYLVTCETRNATYPIIKMILQDPNGIIVGAYSALSMEEDVNGPQTYITLNKDKFTQEGTKCINVTAAIDDTYLGGGWSNIVTAEYFVDTLGESGTGTSMTAMDGVFDSPKEDVWAQINVTGWALGHHVIYVHGKDSKGNWGPLANKTIEIVETYKMHIKSITWGGSYSRPIVNVKVVDEDGNPVEGAEVICSWSPTSLLSSYDMSSKTNAEGIATLRARMRRHGTLTFRVENITKTDWIYDLSANEVPSYTSKYY